MVSKAAGQAHVTASCRPFSCLSHSMNWFQLEIIGVPAPWVTARFRNRPLWRTERSLQIRFPRLAQLDSSAERGLGLPDGLNRRSFHQSQGGSVLDPPKMGEFDTLVRRARRAAKQAGRSKSDVDAAIAKTRGAR